MSTWSLTGVDMTAGLAVTSCSRRVCVGLGVQSQKLCHCQCPWMTLAKLQVDCSVGPKPSRSAWRPCGVCVCVCGRVCVCVVCGHV